MGFLSGLQNLFSGGQSEGYEDYINAIRQGMGQLQGNAGKANEYLNPFYQNGLGQSGTLQSMISRMMNPNQFYKDMTSGYSMSPAAKHQIAIGNDATTNAAMASGMGGSTPHLNDINEQSQSIANRDLQQYFNNMMGIYGQGANTSQNMYNTGFGAGGQMSANQSALGQQLASMYGQLGQAQLGKSQADSSWFNNLLSMGLGIGMAPMTGGGSLLGGFLGNKFGGAGAGRYV